MSLEIERKYLLRSLPIFEDVKRYEIRQAYLSRKGDELRVRLRQVDDRYFLTKKKLINPGDGLIREEFEFEISKEVFDILWEIKLEIPPIIKTRYKFLNADALLWEIDEFHGKLTGLILAEIEIPTMDHYPLIPQNIKDVMIKEVTTDINYLNSNLFLNGWIE